MYRCAERRVSFTRTLASAVIPCGRGTERCRTERIRLGAPWARLVCSQARARHDALPRDERGFMTGGTTGSQRTATAQAIWSSSLYIFSGVFCDSRSCAGWEDRRPRERQRLEDLKPRSLTGDPRRQRSRLLPEQAPQATFSAGRRLRAGLSPPRREPRVVAPSCFDEYGTFRHPQHRRTCSSADFWDRKRATCVLRSQRGKSTCRNEQTCGACETAVTFD